MEAALVTAATSSSVHRLLKSADAGQVNAVVLYPDGICVLRHNAIVAWDIEFTSEFNQWWQTLSDDEQDDVAHSVGLLAELGPSLGFPHSTKVTSSRYAQMRELRTQSGGRPLRTLYAFNPLRTAVLLIGGDKTGDARWYDKFVPVADRLYEQHLEELRKEGKL